MEFKSICIIPATLFWFLGARFSLFVHDLELLLLLLRGSQLLCLILSSQRAVFRSTGPLFSCSQAFFHCRETRFNTFHRVSRPGGARTQ